MVGVFAFPALLPTFIAEWGLSNTEAGWISGIYFGGYALAVPLLMSLTDRLDARRIYILGALVAAFSALAFALWAEGFWTALLFRALGGVGLAGTYMPGLKALVDRVSPEQVGKEKQARWISYYTASFSLGTSLSFLVIGGLAELLSWRAAFLFSCIAAVIGAALAWSLPVKVPRKPEQPAALLDFRPVLRNRPAMGYVLGYTTHMWELFAYRSWVVAFLAFVLVWQDEGGGMAPTTAATLSALLAMASSIIGADLASRFNRRKVIAAAMIASALLSLVLGLTAQLPYAWAVGLALLLGVLIQVDSAALTTGAVQVAEPGRQGATMAVHSLLGFAAAFLGPLAFGAVLDLAGGQEDVASWGWAFASVGIVALLGPLALWWSARPSPEEKGRSL